MLSVDLSLPQTCNVVNRDVHVMIGHACTPRDTLTTKRGVRAAKIPSVRLGNEIALRDFLVNLLGSCRISRQFIIYSGMRNSLLQEQTCPL